MTGSLDLIFIGRIAVDLYGEQSSTPLEETRSFARYPGGSSGNAAIAAARAGAKVGLISAVGNDPMGRYLLRVLKDENVDSQGIARHADRRTALAFLGMLGSEASGIDFYRQQPADAVINADVVPEGYFDGVKTVAFTGTHIADPEAFESLASVIQLARNSGAEFVLDIDYRQDLWASFKGGLQSSKERVIEFAKLCSMIVGNSEEIALLDILEAQWSRDLHVIRKLGRDGAAWDHAGDTVVANGISIDVVNPVGAGDAFLGNLLAGRIAGDDRKLALQRGNAAGALVATRHGCAVEMPYPQELDHFLEHQKQASGELAKIHRSFARKRLQEPILALACDHRVPFDELVKRHHRSEADAQAFKQLVFEAMKVGTSGNREFSAGMLMDPRFGQAVLDQLGNGDFWTGRPIEVTGSRPLQTEAGHDLANMIAAWRPGQVAKVLVWFSPDDPPELIDVQINTLSAVQSACRGADIEWMLEMVPPLDMPRDDDTLIRGVVCSYDAGLHPDWWKLPALETGGGWSELADVIQARDPWCRGVMVLGLNEAADALAPKLDLAAKQEICVGFAIGRSIFGQAAERWFQGDYDDQKAVLEIAHRYRQLCETFMAARRSRCAA